MSVYRAVRDVVEWNGVWPGIGHGNSRQPLRANSTLQWLLFPYSRLGLLLRHQNGFLRDSPNLSSLYQVAILLCAR